MIFEESQGKFRDVGCVENTSEHGDENSDASYNELLQCDECHVPIRVSTSPPSPIKKDLPASQYCI